MTQGLQGLHYMSVGCEAIAAICKHAFRVSIFQEVYTPKRYSLERIHLRQRPVPMKGAVPCLTHP